MANFDGLPEKKADGTATSDDDIVAEAVERFRICTEAEDRDEAMSDLRFLKGEQWEADEIANRDLDNRPCLTFNNIPAILHQVTNDTRQNKQSMQVAPVDDDADVEVAEIIEGLIRHIEYDSGADAAYDTAVSNAAAIGFGFFRLTTEYCDPMSFDQDMKIKRIRNPFTVHIDPNAQEADASDMRYAFLSSKMSRGEFERLYPNGAATSMALGTAIGDNLRDWLWPDTVRVSEYYRIEYEEAELALLPGGKTVLTNDPAYKQALKAGTALAPVMRRRTFTEKVMWYKVTGAQVLERAEIPCKWIPIFPVYGDEIDIDGRVTRAGLIRNAKSPKKMENYWLSSATEEIAMRTKTPFIGALGQFEGMEADWNLANIRNFSYLEYNPVSIEGTLAPAPQRQPPADVPQGFIAMAALARDTVKAVTGIYDASLGARSNEVSGLAIRARQQQGDIANFHFTDNLQRAMKHCARCMIDMIPRIYDTARVIRVLGEDNKTAKPVAINKPGTKKGGQGEAIQAILNDLSVGTYDVTVTTGPAYNTMREEAVANMIELGAKWPKLMEVAGDKIIRAMDWPGAEEIADRVEKTLPPGIADDDEEENMVQTPKGPIPAQQAGQLIGQMDQTMEQMQAEMEDLQFGIAKARIDAASREEVARINATSREDVVELQGMITLLTAKLDPILAHQAAVLAAADPDHPAPPAPIAQGQEPAPAEVQMADQAAAHAAEQQEQQPGA